MKMKRVAGLALLALLGVGAVLQPSCAGQGAWGTEVRFATFNASLNRATEGQLAADLATTDNAQAQAVAEIIQRTAPDVLLLNEFDYDAAGTAVSEFKRNYLAVSQHGQTPIDYPYVFFAPSNTGVPSGFDLNHDGVIGGTDDALGYGAFPGQYGMLVLSRYPILLNRVRTFQHFLWRDMPGARLPDDPATAASNDWYSEDQLAVLPLSSKSHWDVPIAIGGRLVHALVSHPTPPVYDGEEDRNGRRNADEIRFWADYISPRDANYIYDDAGEYGGLAKGESFVILGDLNADPNDGDSVPGAVDQLLGDARINTAVTPQSEGGKDAAARQGGVNLEHLGDAAEDTADFSEPPGNLRADYVLPSRELTIRDAGIFWPVASDPLFRLVGDYPFPSSDHRLVWADLGLRRASRVSGLNLAFIGQATFPTGTLFEGTELGGLSGIDYDATGNRFVAISDDRSEKADARFYQLRVHLDDGMLDPGDVELLGVTKLLDSSGLPFTPLSLDPESIRIAADGKSLFWTSEGDANALVAPFIREMGWDGHFIRELTAPSIFLPTADHGSGIRNNLAFESLTLSNRGRSLFTATENALYQDGPAAALETSSPSRVLEFSTRTGRVLHQYVYETGPVIDEPVPADAFSTNGLVELLALSSRTFLALERSFSTGAGNQIRLFSATTAGATDVSRLSSIADARRLRPMSKDLLLDLGLLPGVVLDNLEGVTFGPRLPDGTRSLILVSDNNFSADGQFTQFLAFKVIE